MNYMEQVAKLLGIKLNERFNISDRACDYMLTENGIKYYHIYDNMWYRNDYTLIELLRGDAKIAEEKSILTKEEKQYLANIIAPFQDNVIHITKHILQRNGTKKSEYISISYKDGDGFQSTLDLPAFKLNTAYRGMRPEEKYTLGNLGL